jgi:indole-3-glycerol phosphate synthase
MTFLSDMLTRTEQAVSERRAGRPLREVQASLPIRTHERVFLDALQKPGMSVIAEFKRSSPAEGQLGKSPVKPPILEEMLQAYERGEASAVSVLTESTRFGGSLDDLRDARSATRLPLLCKDFIVKEYQVYEAAEAGADAVLLIEAALKDEPGQLRRLHDVARGLYLDVLVEVRSDEELDRALEAKMELIGINNRDLDTLAIHSQRTAELAQRIPPEVTIVSESGLRTVDDLERLAADGVYAALIGTALMNAENPEGQCRAFSHVASSDGVRRSVATRRASTAFAA